MDPRAASLVRAFANKLGGEIQMMVRRGSGASDKWETYTRINETVIDFQPEQGIVVLELANGRLVNLHFDEAPLLKLLESAAADWGPEEVLSDEEAAARFMTVHLEESLATRSPGPSNWWDYEDGFFHPRPA